MSERSLWYLVGAALRRLLGGGDQRRGSRRPGSPPRTVAGGTRDPRASRPGSQGRGSREHGGARGQLLDASPGQSGPDATRDATPAELRAARFEYAPAPDDAPDPGEVVWTWVPYAENDGRGKDRPVLIIARVNGDSVLGCYLSTKPHQGFVSIGTGAWDSQGRESYLSPERILRITHDGMRREGASISRERFTDAVRAVLARHSAR